MPLTLRFAVRSDKGLARNSNEDSVYAASHLLAVADGMGGHAAGEIASAAVAARMARIAPVAPGDDPVPALLAGIGAGNADIARRIAERPELAGMGTTVTAVLLTSDGRLALGNVGDSRTYLLRDGELSRLTRDDSLVQSLVDTGRLSDAEAAVHPHRSVVTRAVVGDSALEPTASVLPVVPGDRLLLCSDGLSDLVAQEELCRVLLGTDREVAADDLIALALRAGGSDNVTVVVADVVATDGGQENVLFAPALPEAGDGAAGRVRTLLFVVAALLAAGVCCFLLLRD